MARFRETVDIRQAQTIQRDTSSLTARLDGFADQQIAQHSQNVAQREFAKGQASLIEGEAPVFKEERFFGGIGSKAYNQGLRTSYISSIDRDNREEVARIVAENPSNLTVFNDAIESYRKVTLQNVDPSARQVIGDSLDGLISANRIKVQTNEIKRVHKENDFETQSHVETATGDAFSFSREGDKISAGEAALAAFATIDGRVASGFITSGQGKIQKRDIERGMVEEGLKGSLLDTFDEKGVQSAFDQLDDLSDKVQKGFTPEEHDAFISEAQTELNLKLARQERNVKGSAEKFKKEQDFSKIEKRRNGDDSQIIDPKMIDTYYQEVVVPEMEGMTSEERQATQAQYMDRLKVMPRTIKLQLTNAANSNNPDLLNEAATLVNRIDDITGVVNMIPNTEQAYLQNVSNLLENMDPGEAIDLARRATDPKDKARIEAAESRIKEAKKDDPDLFIDHSADAFSSFFAFDPLIDEVSGFQMAKEYGAMWENLVKAGTSEADAFDKTDKMIKRLWGETEALGVKRVMKYPPETYYHIDNDTSWIKSELVKDVNEDVAGVAITSDNIVLMANDETARTAATGQPTYAVKVLIDGSFLNIGQWRPDKAKEIERRKTINLKKASDELIKQTKLRLGVEDFLGIEPLGGRGEAI